LIDAALWQHPLNIYREKIGVRLTTSLKVASGHIVVKGTEFYPPIPSGILKRAEKRNGAEFIKNRTSGKAEKLIVRCPEFLSIGMKGMPGRRGLTTHHLENNAKYKVDVNGNLLKSILKTDAEFYTKYFV
jgi:hypothetical protein